MSQEHRTNREQAAWLIKFWDVQAEHNRERKQGVYALMHVKSGHKVLDIGCGPGTDTLPLAQIVGPKGQVIGIDLKEENIAEANKRAESAGVSDWLEHKVGDASALPFADGYFDACHAERVFMHLPNSEDVFAELVRVTHSGGWIAIIDFDWGSLSIDTPEVDIERRISAFMGGIHRNPYAGRQLYRLFRNHGLVDTSLDAEPLVFTDLAAAEFLLRLGERPGKAFEAGWITQEELVRFRASLEQADAAGAFYCSMNRVTVVGCKP